MPKPLSRLWTDPAGAPGAPGLGSTRRRHWLQLSHAGRLCYHPRFTAALGKRSGLGAAGCLFNV